MFKENFCIIHRSALFLVLAKELTKSKNNIPFKPGFYIFTYFLIWYCISTGKKHANPDYSSPSLSVISILQEYTY